MSKKSLLYILLCCIPQVIYPIKAIFFDIETIFETDEMRAAGYIGKLDSLRYLKQTGHLPCQKDLFANLMKVPANSTDVTYNNDLKMPLIFSDWLLNNQSFNILLTKTLTFLDNSNVSNIEKTVLSNIVKMMFTPTSLADTQKILKATEKIILQLKNKGYKIYLTGNWADLGSLQEQFSDFLQNFNGIFLSGKLHLLKPYQAFYTTVLEKTHISAADALWVEKETTFMAKAKSYNLNIVQLYPKYEKNFIQDIKKFNIQI